MNKYDTMEIDQLDYEPTNEELKAFNEWLDSLKTEDYYDEMAEYFNKLSLGEENSIINL